MKVLEKVAFGAVSLFPVDFSWKLLSRIGGLELSLSLAEGAFWGWLLALYRATVARWMSRVLVPGFWGWARNRRTYFSGTRSGLEDFEQRTRPLCCTGPVVFG